MTNKASTTSFHRLRDMLIPFSAIPLILILWESAAHFQFINTKLFPSFSAVCKALLDMAYSGELFTDVKASTARAVIGYFFGCFIGISVGIATGRIRVVEQLFGQAINMLRSFPPVALVPFAILWMGLAETSKYFLVFWGVVFPVWVNTHSGMNQIEQNYIRAAQLFGAKDIRLISNVLLPAALPHILAGMRVGIGLCFICVFVAEMSGAYEGVGFRISTSYMVFRVDKMLASLIVLGSMGALADRLFKLAVDFIFPWTRLSPNE